MTYKSILTSLYYLLIYADGNVNDKEISLGKQILKAEGFDEVGFDSQMELYKTKDKASLFSESLAGLKKLDKPQQIRCIAWLCVVANADGFMDKEEWVLIYKIYHTELKLSLDEIMKIQKELSKLLHGRSFNSLGIKVND